MSASDNSNTFAYFAFASNMLRERIVINNPSAVFKAVGKLKDYQLTFCDEYPDWHGGGANIEEVEGEEVWGVVWTMHSDDRISLDRQESHYARFKVNVETADGVVIPCETYQHKWTGHCDVTVPSRQYLDVIVRGAKQHHLPRHYIQFLEKIECNDFQGRIQVYENILKSIGKSE